MSGKYTSRPTSGAPQEGFGFEASNLLLGKPAFFRLHRCHASAAEMKIMNIKRNVNSVDLEYKINQHKIYKYRYKKYKMNIKQNLNSVDLESPGLH